MSAATRKRRDARARYEAARESWRTTYGPKSCPACDGAGTIRHEEGELPCPMCDPDGAREAARGTKP